MSYCANHAQYISLYTYIKDHLAFCTLCYLIFLVLLSDAGDNVLDLTKLEIPSGIIGTQSIA